MASRTTEQAGLASIHTEIESMEKFYFDTEEKEKPFLKLIRYCTGVPITMKKTLPAISIPLIPYFYSHMRVLSTVWGKLKEMVTVKGFNAKLKSKRKMTMFTFS